MAERVTSLGSVVRPGQPIRETGHPLMMSQVLENQKPKAQPPLTTYISLVIPTGGYQGNGMVNGSSTSFLLGTGLQ